MLKLSKHSWSEIEPIFISYFFCQRTSVSYCLSLILGCTLVPENTTFSRLPSFYTLFHWPFLPYDAETSQNIASFVYLPWHLFHTPTSPPTLPCLQGAPSTLYPSSVFLRLVILVAPAWQWEPWGQGQSLILCYSLNKCLLNQIQNFAFTCKDNVKLYIQCITTDTCHSQ